MAKHTLIYFPLPGRAFVTRVCLSMAGVEFEDRRIGGPDLAKLREENSGKFLGQLPVLLVDDVWYTQSNAQYRYAGKLAGLYPENAQEALRVDELLDIINELIGKVPQNPDAEEKQKLRDAWAKDGFVKYAKYIDSVLSSEWAVGDKMSIADLALTGVVASVAGGLWDGIPGDIFDSYKNIKRVFDKTSALEAVKPWMK